MQSLTNLAGPLRRSVANANRRCLHQSAARLAITNLQMPAMSPTMEEGGIASWKKQEGDSFVAGDVLLEIETDKATIDVEAQDDGILGKILAPDGSKNVRVGKVIALLAEEGDNISNLEAPKDEPAPEPKQQEAPPPPTPAPVSNSSLSQSQSPPEPAQSSHADIDTSRPLFPSVHRLLGSLANPKDIAKINGTGVRGMVTKGDILAFLGQASGPLGTLAGKEVVSEVKQYMQGAGAKGAAKEAPAKPLDGDALRRLIVANMLQSSVKARGASVVPSPPATFESIIADYLPSAPKPTPTTTPATPVQGRSAGEAYLDGLY
ncbi:single hybrid motif-containing protein [Athelia psychrophila]|uniref:Single hybrid motif-containing protein n=1 Tax=Athelia psychrophila TaxID=1759441 RepID=A0A166M2H8_9AGAM|nr:single hybrid motif-containing protein [Fibularhizoctonia sp. CBS 109695]